MSSFVSKNERFKWSPLKNLVFWGYSIDVYQGIVKIPGDRIQKVLKTIEDIEFYTLKYRKVHDGLVVTLVRQIVSKAHVIDNVEYIMSKHLSIDILEKMSWNSCIVLSKASLIQINFWKENLRRVNVKIIYFRFFLCQFVVYSDASNTGYGCYIVETPFNIAHGIWSESESTKSPTLKELNAVKHILLSMVDIIIDKRIKWFIVNQNVVSFVVKGDMKPELQDITLCIFENCLTHNLSIDAEWIRRTFNVKADFINCSIDYLHGGVGEHFLTYLDSMWRPYEIDWLSNYDNHKLTVFYSHYWTMNLIGIDSFTMNWNGVNGWFVSPVCLI
ncbi:Hypothetical predicted protein [Mytilus galloprovincialis]|uniref:RNase H type-1 domain-containing protein n=1 Tax=Mytilus galloprovincialis TaxID=29158 RepID=A0A8B6D1U0_MYTGA|nr:Hypothetical predicted protein [Mytilus galloprovincialis]